MDSTVTNATYVTQGLENFYQHYVVPAADQSIQVFQSFTYGEMIIGGLLLTLVLSFWAKWIWEVLR
jgi:hypothetical protein